MVSLKIATMWLPKLSIGSHFPIKHSLSFLATLISTKPYSCYLGKWELPQGHETGITVYNSSANKKVPLILKTKGKATWYMCGPTVYDESHIGHACCYTKFDIIRRIMENVFGINVLLLLGITDIDDKIIKKSLESSSTILEVSRKYEAEFFKDMADLQVIPPSSVCRVTENIPHIISFCKKLIEKDFAYVTDEGNVYFKVVKGVSADVLSEMADDTEISNDPLKKDRRDFVLWKVAKENEPYWVSPWCKGRPGWHIECSVMASNIFGSHLDLHSGGYDLLFPHHSNEKSQSEAYHNCSQWGNYWLHSGLLLIGDEEKMSKSIKNTISIKEFLKDNSVNDFRLLCLQSPYRKNIFYSSETLSGAKGLHKKFHNFINEVELYSNGEVSVPLIDENELLSKLKSTEEQVVSFLADDFNTSQAILCLTELVDVVNENLQSTSAVTNNSVTAITVCANYIDKMLETLGVQIQCKKKMNRDFVNFMDAVTTFRSRIRLFALCQTGEGTTAANYINNVYSSYEQRISFIYNMKEMPSDLCLINEAVCRIYKQSVEFSTKVPNSHCTSVDKKSEKKKWAKLLDFCDELRFSLEKCGIAMKDRKGISTWSLKL